MDIRHYSIQITPIKAIYPKLRIIFIGLHSETFITMHFNIVYFKKAEKSD